MDKYHYNHRNIFIRRVLIVTSILVGIIIISSCFSKGLIKDDVIVPFDNDFVSGILDNGLQYFIRHNDQPKKQATVQLAIKAGSIHEEEDQRGIAHFLEHMGFNGTKHFPKNSLIDFFERIGMRFGAHLNAYTSFNKTVYTVDIPTDDPEIFDQGLQIVQDWLQYLSLDAEEIEKERGVVLDEWRSELGVWDRFFNTWFPVVFQDSRYAERLPIGLVDIIKNAPREQFLSFYQKWYRFDNAVIIITGDVDTDKVQAKIKAMFNSDADTTIAKTAQETTVEPSYSVPIISRDTPAVVLFADDEAPVTEITIIYKTVRDPYANTVGALKKVLIHSMMIEILNNRLSDISEQKNSSINHMFVSQDIKGDASLLDFTLDVHHAKIQQAYLIVLEEIEKLRRYGILESELKLTHEDLIKSMNFNYNEQNKRSNQHLGTIALEQFFMEHLSLSMLDIDWLYKNIKALLSSISLEQINATLLTYFNSPDVSIIMFGPDKTAFPSEDNIVQAYGDMAQLDVDAPSDIVVRDRLMTKLPKLGKIVKETKLPGFDIYKIDLENGATVLYKITDFQADAISLDIQRPGGISQFDVQSYNHASMFFDVFDNSGYSFISPEELRRFLYTKTGDLELYASDYSIQGYGYTNNDYFEIMLQQLYLKFSAPYISDIELDNAKERTRTMILQSKNNPEQVFSEHYTDIFHNNDARAQRITNKDVDTVTAQKLYDLRSQIMDGVKDFTFVFVGNISPKSFKKLVRRYIASLPAGSGKKIPEGQDIIPTFKTSVTKAIKKGKEPKSVAILSWVQDIKTSPSVQEMIVGEVLDSLLNMRATKLLREKEGKTYSPDAWVDYQMYPLRQVITEILLTSDPADMDNLVDIAKSLIDALQSGNISEEDINKAKKDKIKNRELNMQEDDWWAYIINDSIEVGYDLQEYVGDTFNEKVNNVTKEMLVDFVKKYIHDERKLEMFLLPE